MPAIQISVADLDLRDVMTVVDVREPEEYTAGHVPGARNIPLRRLRNHAAELRSAHPVYVVCQSGRRSALASELLDSLGIRSVDIAGGTSAWIAAGRPVER